MLTITDTTIEALRIDGRSRLRRKILEHWHSSLRSAALTVGAEGREKLLNEIDELARSEPELSERDLVMIADIKLVDFANSLGA